MLFVQILIFSLSLVLPVWSKRRFIVITLGPVVQSIVSLTMLLRHQLVKYMLATLSNTLLFFVGKMCSAKDSHIFSAKNNSVFVILTFKILTKR